MIAVLLIVVAGLLLAVVAWMYNGLVRSRNACDATWSQIEVQVKRRYDLIPNLVETVKGYAAHERETFRAVSEARSAAMDAGAQGSPRQRADAENVLTDSLKSLFALSEAYPDLKANQSYLAFQD